MSNEKIAPPSPNGKPSRNHEKAWREAWQSKIDESALRAYQEQPELSALGDVINYAHAVLSDTSTEFNARTLALNSLRVVCDACWVREGLDTMSFMAKHTAGEEAYARIAELEAERDLLIARVAELEAPKRAPASKSRRLKAVA